MNYKLHLPVLKSNPDFRGKLPVLDDSERKYFVLRNWRPLCQLFLCKGQSLTDSMEMGKAMLQATEGVRVRDEFFEIERREIQIGISFIEKIRGI